MSNLLNTIIFFLIVVIVAAVSSTFFYKKGQESAWALAEQLVPLEKDEIYLAVEKTDANGVKFLTVEEISKAVNDPDRDQRELRFRLNLALNGMSLQEYNNKYRGGKQGL